MDIDAYACCVAMKELLELRGETAIAYSPVKFNYSVCKSLVQSEQITAELPKNCCEERLRYIIVDVSDPEYIKKSVPLDKVIEVYDHHTGYEAFWESRIGSSSHIEFIGAAATMIYNQWKRWDMQSKMKRSTALLLIAAILDNTLFLTSKNTTDADRTAFVELCKKENIDRDWCASYFSEVQSGVEADLKYAVFHDIKQINKNSVLPHRFAQLSVWDAHRIIQRLPEIRKWFSTGDESWMLNVIDIQRQCSYFVCDDTYYQHKLEELFDIHFVMGTAKTPVPYLRKEIIKLSVK